MKKSSKTFKWLILLTFLAVPLTWFHLEKFKETEALQVERDTLEANLKTCEENAEASELGLIYDLDGLDVTVAQKEVAFADIFDAKTLEAAATGDCAKTVAEGYFDELLAKFSEVKGVEYSFTANGIDNEVYTVTLFPNASEYTALGQFKNDFEVCAVGGLQPARMNESNLLFTGSCTATYGEEVPALTCTDIKDQLTLEFN